MYYLYLFMCVCVLCVLHSKRILCSNYVNNIKVSNEKKSIVGIHKYTNAHTKMPQV